MTEIIKKISEIGNQIEAIKSKDCILHYDEKTKQIELLSKSIVLLFEARNSLLLAGITASQMNKENKLNIDPNSDECFILQDKEPPTLKDNSSIFPIDNSIFNDFDIIREVGHVVFKKDFGTKTSGLGRNRCMNCKGNGFIHIDPIAQKPYKIECKFCKGKGLRDTKVEKDNMAFNNDFNYTYSYARDSEKIKELMIENFNTGNYLCYSNRRNITYFEEETNPDFLSVERYYKLIDKKHLDILNYCISNPNSFVSCYNQGKKISTYKCSIFIELYLTTNEYFTDEFEKELKKYQDNNLNSVIYSVWKKFMK